jgi:hypothetical protein
MPSSVSPLGVPAGIIGPRPKMCLGSSGPVIKRHSAKQRPREFPAPTEENVPQGRKRMKRRKSTIIK